MLGIERCVIVQTATHGMDNRVTEDALAAKGGAYLGVALLPTTVSDAELRRLDGCGFRGVRFNFMRHLHQAATHRRGDGADAAAGEHRLASAGPHGERLIADMARALERSPVPVVIDHIGRVDAGLGLEQAPFQQLLRLMQNDKFWVKVSGCDRISRTGPPYADAVPFARKLVTRIPGPRGVGHRLAASRITRVRFRTKANWSTSSPRWRRREELRRKLMVDNPRRLYDRRAAS